jgi:hypothetical protein
MSDTVRTANSARIIPQVSAQPRNQRSVTLAVYVKIDPRSKYWQFTMFLTPGIVLSEGASGNVRALDIDRLWASLTGIAVALVLLGIFRLLGVRDQEEERSDAQDVKASPERTATS